nr:hypothetical protein StreXyl84_26040 [Streptomyces sp. Xyl84]
MNGPDKVTEDDHDSPDRTAVTQTACWSLVIGPVDRCKGRVREKSQANTQRTSRLPGRHTVGQNDGRRAGPACSAPVYVRPAPAPAGAGARGTAGGKPPRRPAARPGAVGRR